MEDQDSIIYNGKTYNFLPKSVQNSLSELGIITFRYYPQEHLLINSASFCENFNVPQMVDNMPEGLADLLIADDDREKLFAMAKKIDEGQKKVVERLKTKLGRISRVTIVAIEWDEKGNIKTTSGLIEDIEESERTSALLEALSSDYGSVHYVDYEKNQVIAHRLTDDIRAEYGEALKLRPKYETIIEAYIRNSVIPSEQSQMRELCSIENLKKQFESHRVYIHDYRAKRNGKTIFCRLKAVNLFPGEKFKAFVMGFSDMSKEKTSELEYLAYIDPVTGGNNYNYFKRLLHDYNNSGYLITMDIHQFKLVNSIRGVEFGDKIIKRIWNEIEKFLPEGDIAGHVNADHFVVFTRNLDSDRVIERMQEFTDILFKISVEMHSPRLRPYFGVARWDPDKPIEEVYNQTTVAKHIAKESKDVNYRFYSIEEDSKAVEEKAMEDAFPLALERRQFEVWYQPKYSPVDGMMVGAEALVRWRLDEETMIQPFKFIPLFERLGVIRMLDEYVFDSVCHFIKRRQNAGKFVVPISVNLSRASLFSEALAEHYKAIVDDVGISPKYVPLEITESAAAQNKNTKDICNKFRNFGFPLCIDDFGTGFSSLSLLNSLQFDTLKLDKSLIDDIDKSQGYKLIKHTIALSKDLGMDVTAEGVEEAAQAETLRKLECDSIQGYLYSKPVPEESFVKLLDN